MDYFKREKGVFDGVSFCFIMEKHISSGCYDDVLLEQLTLFMPRR